MESLRITIGVVVDRFVRGERIIELALRFCLKSLVSANFVLNLGVKKLHLLVPFLLGWPLHHEQKKNDQEETKSRQKARDPGNRVVDFWNDEREELHSDNIWWGMELGVAKK